MLSRTSRPNAFTIMELLVAITLTLMLMALIGILFRDTQKAVSQGIATGRVIENSRGLGDQLYQDFKEMVKPADGGFLVVIHHLDSGIRNDQVFFIKNAGASAALAPINAETFTNTYRATHSRVWYGHVQRTLGDGTGTLPATAIEQLVLGRQELLLVGASLTAAVTPLNIYTTGARADSPVVNYPVLPPGLAAQLYSGLTDVSSLTLGDITGPLGVLTTLAADATNYPGNYRAEVIAMSYAQAGERLRVNPTPVLRSYTDPTIPPSLRGLPAYAVAQQHPYFSEGVSDFAVDLAGDFDGDGAIDRVPAQAPPDDRGGSIVWYSQYPVAGDLMSAAPPAGFTPYTNAPGVPGADGIFVFEHTTTANPNARDQWPYMLRVRWRQHDPKGTVVTATSNGTPYPGRWFEQIVPVSR